MLPSESNLVLYENKKKEHSEKVAMKVKNKVKKKIKITFFDIIVIV